MEDHRPLIAIVGSARPDTVGDKVDEAQAASVELGKALARNQCHIAVYSATPQFIEPHVIKGYLEEGAPGEKSITCICPFGASEDFSSLVEDKTLLKSQASPSDDWEVSFYRSLTEIDGMLIVGGGSSTLAAGHIVLSMGIPTVAVAQFGGAARKIWEYLAQSKGNSLIDEDEIEVMTGWTANSADKCVESLLRQHSRLKANEQSKETELNDLRQKAALLEQHLSDEKTAQKRIRMAIPFLIVFFLLFILGITISGPNLVFGVIFFLGIAESGAAGATLRLLTPMLTPNLPENTTQTAPVIGAAVGFVFSVLYLIPQFIGDASFLNPDVTIGAATRVQYMSAMAFAFLAGLGFDFALQQLLQRARERGAEVAQIAPPQGQ
ncbi:MAG: hypothetical protein KC519_14035 [Anaerolineae bacterium]|nr:hypothetical protein [Anaerolineae bacterium]